MKLYSETKGQDGQPGRIVEDGLVYFCCDENMNYHYQEIEEFITHNPQFKEKSDEEEK